MKNYCLLIILFVQLFKGNCQPVIEVDNGKLNLSHLDFKNNPIYKIKGNVLFFKNKSYKNCIKNKPEFIQIPAIWNDILDNSTGFGTYIFYLEKGNDEFLTLEFDNINCAYNLYINKNLVNSAGIYSENEIYYKPGYKKNKVKLHFDSSNVEVALEVSNYSIQNGGICENIFIALKPTPYWFIKNILILNILF